MIRGTAALGLTKTDVEPHANRLWSHIDQTTDHWQWTGPRNSNGGARFTVGNREISAHRAVLLLAGPAAPYPTALTRQSCDVDGCVRHWDWVANPRLDAPPATRTARPQLRPAYQALIAAIVGGGEGWETRARCRGIDTPDAFFPETAADGEPARRFCRACPVQVECGTAAVRRGEEHGIWAGMSERQLRDAVRLVEARSAVAA